MGIFRKDKTEREKVERLEQLLVAEFARQGATGKLVRDPDDPLNTQLRHPGGVFGFANVILLALPEPERKWQEIIRGHVGRMTRVPDEHDLHDPATHLLLRARIMSADIRPIVQAEYALPFADGLIEIMCLDLPEAVTTINDAQLAGLDIEVLRRIARANLWLEEVEVQQAGSGISLVSGSSFFVASQVLDPEFADRFLGGPARGFVAGIPDRHTLIAIPVLGADSVDPISRMAGFLSTYDRDHSPGGFLSPHLFYFSGGQRQQITSYDADGQMSIRADGAFLDAINE